MGVTLREVSLNAWLGGIQVPKCHLVDGCDSVTRTALSFFFSCFFFVSFGRTYVQLQLCRELCQHAGYKSRRITIPRQANVSRVVQFAARKRGPLFRQPVRRGQNKENS